MTYWFDFSYAVKAVAVVLAAGCSPKPERPPHPPGADSASGPIGIRTDRTSYRAGDPIALTIINRGRDTLAFNPCTRSLERESGAAWEPLDEPDRVCTMEAWMLGPGDTSTGRTDLPPGTPPGRYRVALAFTVASEAGGSRLTARSAPVTVQRRGDRNGQ